MTLPISGDDRSATVRTLARLLDSAVGIPGTRIRFGLDSLVGIIPGAGDLAAAAASGYIILSSWRAGAPSSVLARMLLNLGVDTIVGSVPLLGDLFDVGFKANTRNAALLDQHLGAPVAAKRASRGAVIVVIGGVVLIGAGAIALSVVLVRALAALLG